MSTSLKQPFTKNKPIYYVHVALIFFFMFVFKMIPPFEPITLVGMQLLGIFLGLIWGWIFVGMFWPSLLGLIALGFTDYMNLTQAFQQGIGHNNVLLNFFIFPIVGALDEAGVTTFLAHRIATLKIGRGKPFVTSFLVMYSCWFLTAITTNSFSSQLLVWALFYKMVELFNIPKGKYTAFMVVGIGLGGILGPQAFPFMGPTVMYLGAYTGASGMEIPYGQYIIWTWIINFLGIVGYTLFGKFILRLDASALANIDTEKLDAPNKLNKYQKTMFGFFILLIVGLVWTSIMPASWKITTIINTLTAKGVAAFIFLLICICNFAESKSSPIELISKYARWDVLMLMASVMLISNAMGNDATGISAWLMKVLDPIFGVDSTILFIIIITLIPMLITNFFNNLVTAMVLIPIAYNFAAQAGVNPALLNVMLLTTVNMAILTPAACAPAAMIFGQNQWVTPREVSTYGGIICVIVYFVTLLVGYPLGLVLF